MRQVKKGRSGGEDAFKRVRQNKRDKGKLRDGCRPASYIKYIETKSTSKEAEMREGGDSRHPAVGGEGDRVQDKPISLNTGSVQEESTGKITVQYSLKARGGRGKESGRGVLVNRKWSMRTWSKKKGKKTGLLYTKLLSILR